MYQSQSESPEVNSTDQPRQRKKRENECIFGISVFIYTFRVFHRSGDVFFSLSLSFLLFLYFLSLPQASLSNISITAGQISFLQNI